MITNVLREIGGVGIYGVISVCLFFFVFGAVLLWAFQLKKPFLRTMSSLPLQDETAPTAAVGGAVPGRATVRHPEKGEPNHE